MSDLDGVQDSGSADSFFDTNLSDVMGGGDAGGDDAAAGGTGADDSGAGAAPGANGKPPQGGGSGDTPLPGFEKQFFTETGDFNADEAMQFVTSNLPKGYEGIQDVVSPMRSPLLPQQPAQPQGGQQTQEEWERQYEAERTQRENHYKPYTMYRDFLKTAVEEGFTGNEALRRADQLSQEAADKDWQRQQYKSNYERQKESEKKMAEERSFSELIPKSRTNLGVMYTKFKTGEKGFNSLMFGEDVKDASGKVIGKSKGFGEDAINYAFQLQNAGKDIPKDPAEFKKFADDWWIRFTSNLQNIEHVMDIAISRLNLHLQKYTAASLRKQGAQQGKQLATAKAGGRPSPIQRKQPSIDAPGKTGDPFAKSMAGNDFIDSV